MHPDLFVLTAMRLAITVGFGGDRGRWGTTGGLITQLSGVVLTALAVAIRTDGLPIATHWPRHPRPIPRSGVPRSRIPHPSEKMRSDGRQSLR